jgi:hypothetical protein
MVNRDDSIEEELQSLKGRNMKHDSTLLPVSPLQG